MDRLNLTLDRGTSDALSRHARVEGRPRATLARELIREALRRRDALAAQKKLARDYASGSEETLGLLAELEHAQLELLGDEEA